MSAFNMFGGGGGGGGWVTPDVMARGIEALDDESKLKASCLYGLTEAMKDAEEEEDPQPDVPGVTYLTEPGAIIPGITQTLTGSVFTSATPLLNLHKDTVQEGVMCDYSMYVDALTVTELSTMCLAFRVSGGSNDLVTTYNPFINSGSLPSGICHLKANIRLLYKNGRIWVSGEFGGFAAITGDTGSANLDGPMLTFSVNDNIAIYAFLICDNQPGEPVSIFNEKMKIL